MFCGRGEIGRRAGFRFLWATVGVQVPSSAPKTYKKRWNRLKTAHFTAFFVFLQGFQNFKKILKLLSPNSVPILKIPRFLIKIYFNKKPLDNRQENEYNKREQGRNRYRRLAWVTANNCFLFQLRGQLFFYANCYSSLWGHRNRRNNFAL